MRRKRSYQLDIDADDAPAQCSRATLMHNVCDRAHLVT